MNKYKIGFVVKVILVLTLISGSGSVFFDVFFANKSVQAAAEPVIINKGTEFQYTVPQDAESKIEAGIANGFVQSDTFKLNLKKEMLKSFSFPVFSQIEASFDMGDGKFLSVLKVDNQLSPERPYRIATDFVIMSNIKGEISAIKSIPKILWD